jgi:hypothetical protein
MLSFCELLNNIYFQIFLFVIIFTPILIITIIISNKKSNFTQVPHIDNLEHYELIHPGENKEEKNKNNNEKNNKNNNENDNDFFIPPDYGSEEIKNTPENTKMRPNKIYRQKTGREMYEEEQFVSIYDANFGGMLGTNMGLSK